MYTVWIIHQGSPRPETRGSRGRLQRDRRLIGEHVAVNPTEQRRPPVSKRYETKVRMVWGRFLIAVAALKTTHEKWLTRPRRPPHVYLVSMSRKASFESIPSAVGAATAPGAGASPSPELFTATPGLFTAAP